MAIEGLIAEKQRLMEELLRLTAGLQRALLSNDLDSFDADLSRRGHVFEMLKMVDEKMHGQVTPQDQVWIKQLEMIGTTDREIIQMIAMHKAALKQEEEQSRSAKTNLLAEGMLEAKGNRIQIRG